MKRTSVLCRLCLTVSFFSAAACATAQVQPSNSGGFSVDDYFTPGFHEGSVGVGALFSNVIRTSNRPNIDYVFGAASVGYMVTGIHGPSVLRGNLELAPELFGSYVFHGPGNYVAGGTLWIRYNFVQPGWRLVPYFEGGGGGTALDIPDNFDGKIYNWNLDAAIGAHYFLRPNLSLNAEYRLRHISNADMWSHNVGVNTSGPLVGVSLFF
jgi:lipid A 3-O-deacylase